MTLRYLIDTDWAIHYLNGHPQIVQRLKNLRNQGLGISVVSLAELYEGIYYSADPEGSEKGLADLLVELAIVGIDKETAERSAKSSRKRKACQESVSGMIFDILTRQVFSNESIQELAGPKFFEEMGCRHDLRAVVGPAPHLLSANHDLSLQSHFLA